MNTMKTALREIARAVLSATIVLAVGAGGMVIASGGGGSGNAYTSSTLAQFAATTSAQLFGVISDETGSGPVVGATGANMQTLSATSTLGATAVSGTGGPTGMGGRFVGGATSGTGVQGIGTAGNAVGVGGFGQGSAAGGHFFGGATGNGVTAIGSGGGHGIVANVGGASTGAGGVFTGGTNGSGIDATGAGTGNGVAARHSAGFALGIYPDTTSPTFAAVRWSPQDAQPTGAHAVGDMYVTTAGVHKSCTVAGTPGTWQSVSNTGTLSTVAAAGTNQATATSLGVAADWVTVTAADGTRGATLPTGSVARCVRVMNRVNASVLNMYGDNGENDTINGGAADAVFAQAGGTSLVYCTSNGTDWLTY